jgi:RimJ/RimL family protein N-acetyltransferase
LTFERTKDYALVKEIATHPAIYPFISDDYSPSPNDFKPFEDDAIWYVLVKDGDELLGMWMFAPENAICWQVHTCLLPNAYGKRAKQAALEMANWIWTNTTCLRLITSVPEYNRQASIFARWAGMEEYGRNPESYMKTGILHDQILLGMSNPCH